MYTLYMYVGVILVLLLISLNNEVVCARALLTPVHELRATAEIFTGSCHPSAQCALGRPVLRRPHPPVWAPRDYFSRGFDTMGMVRDFGIWRLKSEEDQTAEKAGLLPIPDLLSTNLQWQTELSTRLRTKHSLAKSKALKGDNSLMDDINLIHTATIDEVSKGLAEVVSLSGVLAG
jgi:hypothetical protein